MKIHNIFFVLFITILFFSIHDVDGKRDMLIKSNKQFDLFQFSHYFFLALSRFHFFRRHLPAITYLYQDMNPNSQTVDVIYKCSLEKFEKFVQTGYVEVDNGKNDFDAELKYFYTILSVKPQLTLRLDYEKGYKKNDTKRLCVSSYFQKPLLVFRLLLDSQNMKMGQVFLIPFELHMPKTFQKDKVNVVANNSAIEFILKIKYSTSTSYAEYIKTVVDYNFFETGAFLSSFVNKFLFDE